MGNLTAAYLTDSATFRRYLGTFDDESQVIAVQVHGDRVVAEKSDKGRHPAEPRPVHQTVYSLRQLRHEQAFD